jgi:hypothetical protein
MPTGAPSRARPATTTIVALTYPTIIPSDVSISGCTLLIPDDIPWVRNLTQQLDQVIVQAAQNAGIGVLDERNAFQGHELCTSDPWAQAPQPPPKWPWNITNPSIKDNFYHPDTEGYAKEAHDLRNYLTSIP